MLLRKDLVLSETPIHHDSHNMSFPCYGFYDRSLLDSPYSSSIYKWGDDQVIVYFTDYKVGTVQYSTIEKQPVGLCQDTWYMKAFYYLYNPDVINNIDIFSLLHI